VFVQEYLDAHVPRAVPLDFEDWLRTTSFTDARKAELRVAHDSLHGGRPTKKQASHVDSFGKTEFYTSFKHCRLINSRCDAFKAWSGPMFKAIEQVVYDLDGPVKFIKHVPVPERPRCVAALRKAGLHYFETDFTAFESHFTRELMDVCECQLYRHVLGEGPDVEFLVRTIMGTNRMNTRSGVRARVEARRMSGDMCTSLGNGFTNQMLVLYLAQLSGGSVAGFVEGDDGLFATDFVLTQEMYEALGFTIKLNEVDDPCGAHFCGIICSDEGQIIKDPFKFFQGFGWTHSFVNAGNKIMLGLLHSKSLSALYETPACPIISAIAWYGYLHSCNVPALFVPDGYHEKPPDLPGTRPIILHSTRLLFERKFGISPALQVLAEKYAELGDFAALARLFPPSVDVATCYTRFVVAT